MESKAARFWSWFPLMAAVISSYGPIGYNYGFALYFLTWKHGFVKRGLIGQLFSYDSYMGRGELLAIECAFLAAAYLCAYVLFRKIIFGSYEERLLSAVLLAAPALLPHIGYLFAQPDVTLFLIALASLAVWLYLPAPAAVWLTSMLSIFGLLVHEAYSLMFYPLLLAIMVRAWRRGKIRWFVAFLNLGLVTAAFVCVVHFGALKVSPNVVLAEAQARTNVGIQRQVYDVMASTLPEQLALVGRLYTVPVLRVLMLTVALSLPYWWMLMRFAQVALRADRSRRLDSILFGALMLAPLALCVLGHDTTRWIGASCADVTLYVLYLYLSDEGGTVRSALQQWVRSINVCGWIAYLALIGPYEATGIRAAEALQALWSGR